MPGGIPSTGLTTPLGKVTLNLDYRFSCYFMSSRALFLWQNEDCLGIMKSAMQPPEPPPDCIQYTGPWPRDDFMNYIVSWENSDYTLPII
jgi:hypothetical protein